MSVESPAFKPKKALAMYCCDPTKPLDLAVERFMRETYGIAREEYVSYPRPGGPAALAYRSSLMHIHHATVDDLETILFLTPGITRVILFNHYRCRFYRHRICTGIPEVEQETDEMWEKVDWMAFTDLSAIGSLVEEKLRKEGWRNIETSSFFISQWPERAFRFTPVIATPRSSMV